MVMWQSRTKGGGKGILRWLFFSEEMTLDNHIEYLMTTQSSQNLEEKNCSRANSKDKVPQASAGLLYGRKFTTNRESQT